MSKRPLFIATCFFVVGVLLIVFNIDILVICSAVLISFATVFLFKSNRMPLLFVCMLFLLAGILRTNMVQNEKDSVLREFSGKNQLMTMTVTEFSKGENAVAKFSSQGKTHKVYFKMDEPLVLNPGDIVKANITFSKPYSDKVTLTDFSSYLLSRRIYLYGLADSVEICGQDKKGLDGLIYSAGNSMNDVGKKHFGGETRALFNSIVFGDKHLMDDSLTEKLQKAGLNHIAAVSGMHLSVFIEVFMIFLSGIFGRRRRGSLFSIPVIIIITLLTGAGASVVRACIMSVVYALSRVLRRENDPLTSLSVSVLLMTVFNPYIVFNAGFVLSVSAVLGIFLFNDKVSVSRWYLPEFLKRAVAVTVSAQLTVTIPVLYYFGILTPYSVLSNLLVIPFSNLSIIAGMALVITEKIPIVGMLMAFIENICLSGIVAVCDIVEKFPSAVIDLKLRWSFVTVWVFILTLIFIQKRKSRTLLRLTAIFLAVFLVVVGAEIKRSNSINIHFVNYGSRDMTTAFFPDGETLLVDCPEASAAINLAENYEKSRYDWVVFSSTYTGKLEKLAENGFVGEVIVADFVFDKPWKKKRLEAFENQGIKVVYLEENQLYVCKNAQIKLYRLPCVGNDCAAAEIKYMDKTFVFLQSFNHNEIEVFKNTHTPLYCDYLKLPGQDFHRKNELFCLTNGKILKEEKELTVNLY